MVRRLPFVDALAVAFLGGGLLFACSSADSNGTTSAPKVASGSTDPITEPDTPTQVQPEPLEPISIDPGPSDTGASDPSSEPAPVSEPSVSEPTTTTIAPADAQFCASALDRAETQLDGFRSEYTDPNQIPRSFDGNETRLVAPRDWTSGFVAGSFWYLFEHTQDPSWQATAEVWTAALESQKDNTTTHDVGFIMFNSFGNGLRLTGNADYEPILVQSAESLITRFNAVVGAILSWDSNRYTFPVIVDNMMNLELLYWASEATSDPRFAEVANTHSMTTAVQHLRDDFSSYHVVDFDPNSGEVIARQTHQGIADESDWARGQAWGLYGFTMAHRFTGDPEFLSLAQNIAGHWLSHPSLPSDHIPYFDFDVGSYPEIENTRDASAAAIVASALLELYSVSSEQHASRYLEASLDILRSLTSADYLAEPGENGHFLLRHSTGNYPSDSEIDVALNYADYYYLEALTRCVQLAAE